MPYPGNPRGALWNRWDLHVHTPASYEQEFGDRHNPATWDRYFDSLANLPRDIAVLGINDYFSVEGYRRVSEAWRAGRLPNIRLVLPMVELRLEHLAGHAETQRLNLHVVFSPDVSPDEIRRSFLGQLFITMGDFSGCVGDAEGMASFGRAVKSHAPSDRCPRGSDERVGYQHAFVPLDDVTRALERCSDFRDRALIALGYSEWEAMRWDGGGGAIKRSVAERADFFFGSSETPAAHSRHVEKLTRDGVNHKLLDASDAHRFADDEVRDRRLGDTMTWIKADLSFEGLRRALQRYDERVYVGDEPPQLTRVRANPNRYLRKIEIRRLEGSTLDETWFDNEVSLNPGLVAVIGNQGGGKSALTDSIALTANAENQYFSFLDDKRFRKGRPSKASHFRASITWEDGETQHRGLHEGRSAERPERARYIPQDFFDKATNEIDIQGTGTLYDEIEKAVFSHIPPAERQGCTSFRGLVELRTRVVDEKLATLRDQLADVNAAIVRLEEDTSESARSALRGRIHEREELIARVRENPPVEVPAPRGEGEDELEPLRRSIDTLSAQVRDAQQREAAHYKASQSLRTLRDSIVAIAAEAERERSAAFARAGSAAQGVEPSDVLRVVTDVAGIEARANEAQAQAVHYHSIRSEDNPESDAFRLRTARADLDRRTQALTAARRSFESYKTDYAQWQHRLRSLQADLDDPDALDALLAELQRIELDVPARLAESRGQRRAICSATHRALTEKLEIYRDLARHVDEFLRADPLTRDHYRLEFELVLTPKDVTGGFFGLVKYQGPFAGADAACRWVQGEVDTCDFADAASVVALAESLEGKTLSGATDDEKRWESVTALMRVSTDCEALYDWLFGLRYIAPRYRLALHGQPLEQLSPGQRGILLLIFYLIVDKSDLPLIIDQPEGNLNNQSIYEHLVPVIRRAKETRQIIMVSHNPNIVVGCDADQIIHAQLDARQRCRLTYDSGALENPMFREFTIEKLEGTRPAFEERKEAYLA